MDIAISNTREQGLMTTPPAAPDTCPGCHHPAASHPSPADGGAPTCTRTLHELPSCRDCAALIESLPQVPYENRNVNLHARITIGDKTAWAGWRFPLWQWEEGGEHLQASVKEDVRRRLAEEIVKQLDPEVVVEMPQPTFAEAISEQLAKFDAANSSY